MLIKEYHIPLPLTVEEYRIAQLYMIQKKSREESEGEGSAVEILENKPYTDGPNGSGQYTYKVYHIGRHLPNWFRGIAPKTALEVHEESWNAYPYTKTIFKVPFVEKFSLEVETYFIQDGGTRENIFKLSPSELRSQELDVIDIVNDKLGAGDYKEEEDPELYLSTKTGRGELKSDWISNPPNGVIMCAYKLIKVEFRYWGLQSKVERFIHDYGLRRVMLRAHRQAWAWQDEWVGLTMTDIRRLERETQFILQKKLGRIPQDAVYQDEEEENNEREVTNTTLEALPTSSPGKTCLQESCSYDASAQPKNEISRRSHPQFASRTRHSISHTHRSFDIGPPRSRRRTHGYLESGLRNSSDSSLQMKASEFERRRSALLPEDGYESDDESMYSARPEWAFDQIAMLSDESDLEFFDAQETMSNDEDDDDVPIEEDEELAEVPCQPPPVPTTAPEGVSKARKLLDTRISLSATSLPVSDSGSQRLNHNLTPVKAKSVDYTEIELGSPYVQDLSEVATPDSRTVDILFLVFHGGSALDCRKEQIGKAIDFQTLSENIHSIIALHFHSALGRVALRMVPCVNMCCEALRLLCEVNPTPVSKQQFSEGLFPSSPQQDRMGEKNRNFSQSFKEILEGCPSHIPVGTVPLLATEHHEYNKSLVTVSKTANKIYCQFLESDEGMNFNGQVCLLADCMGSLAAYDIISSSHVSPRGTPSPKIGKRNTSSRTPEAYPEPRTLSLTLQTNRLSVNSGSNSSLSSSGTLTDKREAGIGFMFGVSHFFAFGSPLGLILGSRRLRSKTYSKDPPPRPNCMAFYNLFYGIDPMASRLEPLLDSRFSEIDPISVPSYRLYPSGIAKANSLKETVIQYPHLLGPQTLSAPQMVWERSGLEKRKSVSTECLDCLPSDSGTQEIKPFSVWWSVRKMAANRIDYALDSPQGAERINLLPQAASSQIIYSRYWEAKELVSFMLRQVLQHDSISLKQTVNGKELIPFLPEQRVSAWKRRTTAIKINRLSPNHRVSDMISTESGPMSSFTAKFQYGPLAMTSLCKEEVEVYLLMQFPKAKWELLGGGVTDKYGKFSFTLPSDKRYPPGVYPVKFLVKGDHTTASCNLFIIPPHIEAVVFSLDGSLASNFSISARDMKVKQGAVETARCWQERGYLPIYITGRPLIQKEHILSFLGVHDFPLGLIACADSLSSDPQTFKTMYLARLIKEAKIIIHVAYGSQRHLTSYKELGLQPDQIYILGNRKGSKLPRNQGPASCQYLIDGFSGHLDAIEPRKASYDARKVLGEIRFVLPGVTRSEEAKKRASKIDHQAGHHRQNETVRSNDLRSLFRVSNQQTQTNELPTLNTPQQLKLKTESAI